MRKGSFKRKGLFSASRKEKKESGSRHLPAIAQDLAAIFLGEPIVLRRFVLESRRWISMLCRCPR